MSDRRAICTLSAACDGGLNATIDKGPLYLHTVLPVDAISVSFGYNLAINWVSCLGMLTVCSHFLFGMLSGCCLYVSGFVQCVLGMLSV